MNTCIKFLFTLMLAAFFLSCSDDNEIVTPTEEDFSGIEYTTTRSGGNSNGVGVACNLGDLFDLEILDEAFEGGQSLYAIIAGDDIDIDGNFLFSAGVSFRIFWLDEGEIATGTYEAMGMSLNVEDPENLEDNVSRTFAQDLQVELTEINDELMEGTFSGTFQSRDEVEETISGRFSVDRYNCN